MNQRVRKFFRDNYEGWLFNLPLVIGLLVFTAFPVGISLFLSFFRGNGINAFRFVGWENFAMIFTRDRVMGTVVKNTLVYTAVNIPLTLVLSYLFAVMVNQPLGGIKAFRVLYYLPCIIPGVVSGLLWQDLYNPTFGVFNQIIKALGGQAFPFFTQPQTSMVSVFIMNLWSVGGGMILWLAAFKNIPKELYECASLEGANAFHRLVHITLPMSTPMIFFNFITSVIGTLQYNGTMTYAPGNGTGVENSLYMYAVRIYHVGFTSGGDLGYASALAWMLFLVIGILTLVIFKTSRWVFYGEDA